MKSFFCQPLLVSARPSDHHILSQSYALMSFDFAICTAMGLFAKLRLNDTWYLALSSPSFSKGTQPFVPVAYTREWKSLRAASPTTEAPVETCGGDVFRLHISRSTGYYL